MACPARRRCARWAPKATTARGCGGGWNEAAAVSLILEALRRSEAERRRGQAPSLLDGLAPPRDRARPLWPVALGGLLGGLLLAAAVAWWLRPLPGADVPIEVRDEAPPPAPVTAPVTAPAAAPAPPPAIAATPAAAPPDARDAARPPPVTQTPLPPPAVAATPAVAAPPAPADPHLGPLAGDLAVADLPAPLRAGLPPLRLSVHVFAEDPARRFAIVDGARLREGEALVDGLQLQEIRRDGLRLAWQGRSLWLPR
jgi:general secretion pathway protein B